MVGLGYSNSVLFQEQYTNFYSAFTHHLQFSTLFLTPEKLQKKQYTNFTPDLTSIYKFTPCFDPQKIMKINEILYTVFTTVLNFQYTNGSAVLVVKSIHWIIQNYTHSKISKNLTKTNLLDHKIQLAIKTYCFNLKISTVTYVAFPSSWNSGVKSATTRVKGLHAPCRTFVRSIIGGIPTTRPESSANSKLILENLNFSVYNMKTNFVS